MFLKISIIDGAEKFDICEIQTKSLELCLLLKKKAIDY